MASGNFLGLTWRTLSPKETTAFNKEYNLNRKLGQDAMTANKNAVNTLKSTGALATSKKADPGLGLQNVSQINLNDVLNEYSSDYSGGYGGGGGMTDLSNIFKSLEQGAESERAIAQQTYNTKREDLLNSLKRFQEQNARDVANQQKAYLSNQASLESAIAQADRQNRISAAARGLGGSGLQQLAQLQNLLSQGQTISDMATENQSVMDTLRRALAEKEEDTATAEARALTDYNNTLSKIASNLAMNKANYEYQARENAATRAANAANYAAAQEQANKELAGGLSQTLNSGQTKFAKALYDITFAKDTDLKSMINPFTGEEYNTKNRDTIKQMLYQSATDYTSRALGGAGIGTGTATSNSAFNNLSSILNNSKYLTTMSISDMNKYLANMNK